MPLAIATEPCPSEVAVVVVPFCTRAVPLVDTLIFCPLPSPFRGSADAAHGVARPAPIPRQTANAPTRPTYFPLFISRSPRLRPHLCDEGNTAIASCSL